MNLIFAPLTQANALRIADDWHYPAPYDFYDMTADPEDYAELIDPAARGDQYFQVTDERGALIGFYAVMPTATPGVLELGLGMAPARTGHGDGGRFLAAVLADARSKSACREILLDVAAFNTRAQKVYARAGFTIVRTHVQETNGGAYPFIEMRAAFGDD
ncbi:GNAT family N-acetyltransferase [Lacticaseibacillus kribbianus]|uniref:GNAT family N-acetyltransferase n=1 Tax=Lacticaseibacillus kribbianus TaxID=2926292 RepID=UPI001CD50173|nr:GNAT family protein [Lacticaseibacillus kribbianus]